MPPRDTAGWPAGAGLPSRAAEPFVPPGSSAVRGPAVAGPEVGVPHVDDTELLGLSIDSVYSHIAWVRNIEEKTGVAIPFPVIADLDRKVATCGCR